MPFLISLSECEDPVVDDSTSVSVTGFDVGEVAIYACNAGFLNLTGPSLRSCELNGEWSEDPPTCSPIGRLPMATYRPMLC